MKSQEKAAPTPKPTRPHPQQETAAANGGTATPEWLGVDGLREMPATPGTRGLRQNIVLQLQRKRGNAYTQQRLISTQRAGNIQRVVISNAPTSETLHNERTGTPGSEDYKANTYTVASFNDQGGAGNIRYEMTRAAGGVTVNVRIKFVAQLGSGAAGPTAIPEGPVQDFARTQCTALVNFWNNKFELVGRTKVEDTAGTAGGSGASASPGGEEIRLPLTFQATPVFDIAADAHSTVRLDSTNQATGAAGQALNANTWFTQKNDTVYPASFDSIYAHEYGHLLGIPDEYSLSNPNMHALFHDVSPSQETQMNNALDRAGIREMVLAAIRPRMLAQINNISGEVAAAVEAQKRTLSQSLAKGLRTAWQDGSLATTISGLIRPQLEAANQTRALAMLDEVVRFQTRANYSNVTIANNVIAGELSGAAIQSILRSTFSQAATAAARPTIDIPFTNSGGAADAVNVSIEVAPVVSSAASPLNAAATSAAEASIGTPEATPPGGRRTPPLYPSHTLIGRLTSLPGSWRTMANLMQNEIDQIPAKVEQAVTGILAGTDVSGQVNNNVRSLYRVIYQMIQNVSTSVGQDTVRSFLSGQIRPLMDQQISDLLGWVDSEVQSHQTATGTGTNANPNLPPDPALAAAVRQIEQQTRQMLNPAAPAGGGTANVPVRFTTNSLMGNNNAGTGLRSDQMSRIADNFNSNVPQLRQANEENFSARSKS
ncbi:MAG: hypothetical protein KJ063_23130 [Anaerolineae bacterium]|nr:hypothetical protein [Anaerolineae bacterium]